MITVFGIRNCDKCRAAIKWFTSKGAEFVFHDVRADGLRPATLRRWQAAVGDDALMNKRSPTWRAIPNADKTGLDAVGSRKLILANPTLIKRPLVEQNGSIVIGYDEAAWAGLLTNGKHIK